MRPMIQCVPNFSEGRDEAIVEAIVEAARDGAQVADYSHDRDHNRMVVTLLGAPDDIRRSIDSAARVAVESIDMRAQCGEHPRIGAVDVVPLVPIRGITMDECVEVSRVIGADIADMGVPVYFYENSALSSSRAKLADIRLGGCERLFALGLHGERAPDLGPNHPHPTAGATVVGARGPLIAYNINLQTSDIDAARRIARKVRGGEAGLTGVKAIGVSLASRSIVQVSMNVTMPHITSVGEVFRFVKTEAENMGVGVAESEFIGVVSERFLEGTSPEELMADGFKETQILEHWL